MFLDPSQKDRRLFFSTDHVYEDFKAILGRVSNWIPPEANLQLIVKNLDMGSWDYTCPKNADLPLAKNVSYMAPTEWLEPASTSVEPPGKSETPMDLLVPEVPMEAPEASTSMEVSGSPHTSLELQKPPTDSNIDSTKKPTETAILLEAWPLK